MAGMLSTVNKALQEPYCKPDGSVCGDAQFFSCGADTTLTAVKSERSPLKNVTGGKVALVYFNPTPSDALQFFTKDKGVVLQAVSMNVTTAFLSGSRGLITLGLTNPGDINTLQISVTGTDSSSQSNYTVDTTYVCDPKSAEGSMFDLATKTCTPCIKNGDCSYAGSNNANTGPAIG